MIQLFGFQLSNYYNCVKMCLLEKDIPFSEHNDEVVLADDVANAGAGLVEALRDTYLEKSPVGKIPCIGTKEGYLSETQVILDYLEDAYPAVPLLPREPFARAKARELVRVLDLHIELVMRRLYSETFFGGSADDATKREVREQLEKGIRGVTALTTLSPFAFGTQFTQVDCVAALHLPLLQIVLGKIYGEDLTKRLPNLPAYMARVAERPSYLAATATIRHKLAELGLAAQ